MSKRIGEISQKLTIFERNVYYKRCRVLNGLFTDFISLTLGDIAKVKKDQIDFFKWYILFFISEFNNRCREFSKIIIFLASVKVGSFK